MLNSNINIPLKLSSYLKKTGFNVRELVAPYTDQDGTTTRLVVDATHGMVASVYTKHKQHFAISGKNIMNGLT